LNYKKLIKTALLAGEMLIVSGAEMKRVEDTLTYILSSAKTASFTVFAVSTGITISLWTEDNRVYTLSSRVRGRDTNLNVLHLVNEVSRDLADKKIDVFEAYDLLCDIKHKSCYGKRLKFIAYVAVCTGFGAVLGGSFIDCLCAFLIGLVLAGSLFGFAYYGFNPFFVNMFTTLFAVFSAYMLNKSGLFVMNRELVVICSIMPLLPGIAFTTAVRDILNGDYISGSSRMLEAVVIALSIVSGAGVAIWIFKQFFG
jgi:hypothetical protein